jgi:galactose mutarotase-like enzyme
MEHEIRWKSSYVEVLDVGGTVKKFVEGGEDVFFPWRDIGDGKTRGGCFACLPWFGSSIFASRKHGYLRDTMPYEKFESDISVNLNFCLPGNNLYPWSMKCSTRTFIHQEDALEFSLRVERTRDGLTERLAPILPAFHPYFPFKLEETEVVIGDQVIRNSSFNTNPIPLYDIKRIIVRTPRKKVEIELGGGFLRNGNNHVVLWTDSPEEYVCVEPVLGMPGTLGLPKGLFLNQGQVIEISAIFHV